MMNKSAILAFCLSATFTLTASANDDEMKTEIKPGSGATGAGPTLPADGAAKLPPPAKPPSSADLALRSKVRKKAPFWIDDSAHGAAVRINKDGTFSSEAQGGGSIAGQWKAVGSELHLQWSDGGEKYSYPLGGKGADLTIRGKKIQKNRYHLN